MHLETFLEQSALRSPAKVALVCGNRRWTYADVDQAANQLAHGLLAAGIQRGDRVAVCLENSFEAVVAIFAILKAGAVFVMVNPTTKSDKLATLLNNSRASALIAFGRKLMAVESLWSQTPHLATVVVVGPAVTVAAPGKAFLAWEEVLTAQASRVAAPAKRVLDIDLAALLYTSGSTGTPKGVMFTHLNIVSAITSITSYLKHTGDDILLNVLPLSFGYGMGQVFLTFQVGGTLILERSFTYPHAVLQKLVSERATGFALVPTMAAMLLELDLGRYDLSSLRYVTSAGAALPVEHLARLRQNLPQTQIIPMYGQTECLRASYLPPEEVDARPASVGRGMPNEEVYLVDDEGNRLGPGSTGTLVVRGAHVMQGYWEMPEETARVLKPGPLPGEKVLSTGDLFRTDLDGYLYFLGRKDDIIKTRGEKVSPREVENALCSHPEVSEAAVLGVPDALLGQAVKALVTRRLKSTVTEQELLRHCAARLEDFMVPKILEFRETLPRSANGKIDKRALAGVVA